MQADHFDQLETRDPEARETAQLALVPALIRRARELAPGWAEHLAAIDAEAITSREALAALPLMRKSALKELQVRRPPFGGLATAEAGRMRRIFMSPGPIFEPEGLGERIAAEAGRARGERSDPFEKRAP